jgi:superfamily II DNA or RNA helicase
MLTHVKELIEQNAEKMLQHWPNAPLGIYSASVGRRDIGEPITFAGIMSVRKKARAIGRIDLVLVDECHLINHKETGSYREFINDLREINPHLRVVGLTATPYRLGHGVITDKPALFDALVEPVKIEELVLQGYLAPLRSKVTKLKLDTSGVHTRGGEFIEKYVFPHGELPHIGHVLTTMQEGGLEALDVENMRRHYAQTCALWADNFERNTSHIRSLVDEKRYRIWRIYLAGCAHAFTHDWISLNQIVCGKAGRHAGALRKSRAYMYRQCHATEYASDAICR